MILVICTILHLVSERLILSKKSFFSQRIQKLDQLATIADKTSGFHKQTSVVKSVVMPKLVVIDITQNKGETVINFETIFLEF